MLKYEKIWPLAILPKKGKKPAKKMNKNSAKLDSDGEDVMYR